MVNGRIKEREAESKMQRWYSDKEGLNGSPTGLIKLPNGERARLYRYLTAFVPSGYAHGMRDWRPTKIVLFLESMVAEEGK